MKENQQRIFSDMPVKSAVFKMAIPGVVSSLVLVIYNMADTFFVGQTNNAFQVAAVSLTNPIFVMFMAFAILLGIGGSTAISIFLGEKNNIEVKKTSSFCCYASLFLGTILGIVIIIFMDPILKLLGSSENTYKFSKEYLFYIALGAPFIFFTNTFGHAVRGEGGDAPVAAMGVIIKVYLLIVFIHMGITNGIQPLLGYCFGAKRKERFVKIFKFSGILTIIIGSILTAIYIIFSKEIIEFFINDKEVIFYGKEMLIATAISGPILGVLFLCINSLQAIDRPFLATAISICRQGFIYIPLLYILNNLFGLTGINFTQIVSDYISIILSVLLFKMSINNLKE